MIYIRSICLIGFIREWRRQGILSLSFDVDKMEGVLKYFFPLVESWFEMIKRVKSEVERTTAIVFVGVWLNG